MGAYFLTCFNEVSLNSEQYSSNNDDLLNNCSFGTQEVLV